MPVNRQQIVDNLRSIAYEASKIQTIFSAPVAQLDRVPDYESVGRRFESCRVRHIYQGVTTDTVLAPFGFSLRVSTV